LKTYGRLEYGDGTLWGTVPSWRVTAAPHVLIRMKNVFPRANTREFGHVTLKSTLEVCRDLEWFCERYPLDMSGEARDVLTDGAQQYRRRQEDLEAIMLPDAKFGDYSLSEPLREYQARSVALYLRAGSLLVADQLGLGKTVTAIGSFTDKGLLPVLVVCQTHLVKQWERFIARFLPLARVHVVQKTTTYNLPAAEVYITTYSKLAGWAEIMPRVAKSVVFDEVQELRHSGTAKYDAAKAIAVACTHRLGLSATPIYNYGGEMYNVIEVLSPAKLGSWQEFQREWCDYRGNKAVIKDTAAFGEYLRDNHIMVRNTRSEVGLELPTVERIVQTVPYTAAVMEEIRDVATELARIVLQGHTFEEKGQAAREFDLKLRMATGIAKAPYVAEFVKMLIEDGQNVLLFGWHRAVYDIWKERLREFNPVFYTGTESPKQKEDALRLFKQGYARLIIMSLRSGSGVDGIQTACKTAVFGELDWSPGVHEQCIGRLNRDGSIGGVSSFFLVADGGSDPVIAEVLGLKTEQVRGIVDPQQRENVVESQVDVARVKRMAEAYLQKRSDDKEYVRIADGSTQSFGVIDGGAPAQAFSLEVS
jgi:SNF2 family DNA or RNA helicase